MGLNILQLIKVFNLNVLNVGSPDLEIVAVESNRCGLQLSGFYNLFEEKRIQIIGNAENAYLQNLSNQDYTQALYQLIHQNIPCLIMTNNLTLTKPLLDFAKSNNRWILSTEKTTSRYIVDQTLYLQSELADSITIHGVLMDVYGIGVLITGDSGIGKSETAIDLIRDGHLLIADDAVVIKKISGDLLMGTSTELTRNLIECRGVGIVNINSLYGKKAIRQEIAIDIVMNLTKWDENAYYDRLGEEFEKITILENELTLLKIPVKPGRSLSAIVEIGVLNFRQNEMGYNAAKELSNAIRGIQR